MRKGWEIKKLGEVCDVVGGGTPSKTKKEYFGGNVLWATVRDMNVDLINDTETKITELGLKNSSSRLIQSGSVIIATRVGLGKVCLLEKDSAINQDLKGIIPKKGFSISNKFIFWWCKNIASDIQKAGTGLTVQGVKLDFINSLKFPLLKLSEQQRIVSILDEAFSSIEQAKENLQRNLQNAKELFQSEVQAKFVDKISGRNYESLENLCELIVDCEHKTAPTQATGYPSIRTPNIGKGVLILDGVNRVSEETYVEWTRRAIPQANDLILAREAPAGNVAVIPENLKVCLGQRTVLIRPKKEKFNSTYLAYLLLSKDVQKSLLSHSTGATVTHINMKDIRAFKIYNLASITDQQKIVQQLDKLSTETKRLEAMYQQKLDALEELKKSILQKAFSGELSN